MTATAQKNKSPTAFKTISEVAEQLNVPQHVLRFWESKFSQIKPLKLKGGRRYYRPEDVDALLKIQHLLYNQGYTIKGAKIALDKKQDIAIEPVAVASQKAELLEMPAIAARAETVAKAGEAVTKPATEEKKKEVESLIKELSDIRDMLKSCA